MFENTKTRLRETAEEAARKQTSPILTALWTIAGLLGLLFLALVTRGN